MMSSPFRGESVQPMGPHVERATRVLFVDDEPNIRLTLPRVLKGYGFDVTTAASVAQALEAIHQSSFDVLLSDLNISEEGDGFLVVTAMRHAQPNCVTVILTGYPAFETALQAIRHQVDDYLVKPAGIEDLVASLRHKLTARGEAGAQQKKITAVLAENLPAILARLPHALESESRERPRLWRDDGAVLGHLPRILEWLLRTLETESDEPRPDALTVAAEHGLERRKQGYGASAILADFEALHVQIFQLAESSLLSVDPATLLSDLRRVERALYQFAKHSIAAYDDSGDKRIPA